MAAKPIKHSRLVIHFIFSAFLCLRVRKDPSVVVQMEEVDFVDAVDTPWMQHVSAVISLVVVPESPKLFHYPILAPLRGF